MESEDTGSDATVIYEDRFSVSMNSSKKSKRKKKKPNRSKMYTPTNHQRSNKCSRTKDMKDACLCALCGRSFTSRAELQNHKLTHTDIDYYECWRCNAPFFEVELLRMHIDEEHENFNRTSGQDIDILEKIGPLKTAERGRSCQNGATTKNDAAVFLEGYKLRGVFYKSGKKLFICLQCEKTFSQSAHLYRHIRIHTGFKPYKCNICEKDFTQKGDLNNHKNIHLGIRPFKCTGCGKTYTQRQHLRRHSKRCIFSRTNFDEDNLNKSKPVILKRFMCDICDFRTNDSRDMRCHMNIHTGERELECPYCGMMFSRGYVMQKHIKRQHINSNKLYVCSSCGFGLKSEKSKRLHLKKFPDHIVVKNSTVKM